jgi:hypothetical protein
MKEKALAKIPRDAGRASDHLLLGIADLDEGVAWFQEKAGVKAIMGGSHPGEGTRNALVSMGDMRYIEIISLDPMQKRRGRIATLVQNLAVPQVIAWAASTANIDALRRQAQAAGYPTEGPTPGKRVKPDGGILRWKILRILSRFGDVIPFFIEWGVDITHPSQDSPSGCRLEELAIEHPEAGPVRETLLELGISATVNRSSRPNLKATLSTPKGSVVL